MLTKISQSFIADQHEEKAALLSLSLSHSLSYLLYSSKETKAARCHYNSILICPPKAHPHPKILISLSKAHTMLICGPIYLCVLCSSIVVNHKPSHRFRMNRRKKCKAKKGSWKADVIFLWLSWESSSTLKQDL